MQYRGHRSYGSSSSGYFPPAVKWLIIVNCGIFALEWVAAFFLNVAMPRDVYLYPVEVLQGRIWQLFTYMFFHAGLQHLLLNMLTLWMFGMSLERDWGAKRFLKFYFLCGVGAGLCVVLVTTLLRPGEAGLPTLGASGAIWSNWS